MKKFTRRISKSGFSKTWTCLLDRGGFPWLVTLWPNEPFLYYNEWALTWPIGMAFECLTSLVNQQYSTEIATSPRKHSHMQHLPITYRYRFSQSFWSKGIWQSTLYLLREPGSLPTTTDSSVAKAPAWNGKLSKFHTHHVLSGSSYDLTGQQDRFMKWVSICIRWINRRSSNWRQKSWSSSKRRQSPVSIHISNGSKTSSRMVKCECASITWT